MSVSNYILNQRISSLQYQINNLGPDFAQNLSNVLLKGNQTGYTSIVNNDSTMVLNTSSNNSSLTLTSGANTSVLSASDLTFNGASILPVPVAKTLINIVSTTDFTVNTPAYYTSSLKNGVAYLTPSVSYIELTIINALSSYNILVLSSTPDDGLSIWANLNDSFISRQVCFSFDSGFLVLNSSDVVTAGTYTLNLPSFSYLVD
jgi:hypothetical protein